MEFLLTVARDALLRRGSWVRGPAGSPRARRDLSQILPVLFLRHACSAMSAPGDFLPEKPVSSPVAKGIGMKDRQGSSRQPSTLNDPLNRGTRYRSTTRVA